MGTTHESHYPLLPKRKSMKHCAIESLMLLLFNFSTLTAVISLARSSKTSLHTVIINGREECAREYILASRCHSLTLFLQ